MPEMPHPGENRSQAETVRGFDHFLVPYRASGLNDCRGARFGDFLDAIREWEKGIGGGDRSLQGQLRLHGTQLAGIDAAHLSGPDAYDLAVVFIKTSIDDGVRLYVLAHFPREQQ